MISVVVYGRNDSHGYNFHKRAVLSLNAIAEILTHPNDEIIFVDWNSPRGTPAMPVAVADLLTPRVHALLRIIQVPQAVHQNIVRGITEKVVLEPVARNVGIRRANPANEWILSTNLDVILRVSGGSISDIVESLDHTYYACPRFELPEWIWESFNRSDPASYFAKLEWLSGNTSVNQIVLSNPFALFDAPGDFQLMRRDALTQIGCFDETMLLGWHVDSNLARRMNDAYGPPKSLSHVVEMYHCNHTRSETDHHKTVSVSNDLETYVFGEVPAIALSGKDDWGLPEVSLVESTLADADSSVSSALAVIAQRDGGVIQSSFISPAHRLCGIPASNSMPFILDQLQLLQGDIDFHYIGTRPEVGEQVRTFLDRKGSSREAATGADARPFHAPTGSRLVLVDLTPREASESRGVERIEDLSRSDQEELTRVFLSLDKELALEKKRPNQTTFLFVNAEYNELTPSIVEFFTLLPVQYYSRLRIGLAIQQRNDSPLVIRRKARAALGIGLFLYRFSSSRQFIESVPSPIRCALRKLGLKRLRAHLRVIVRSRARAFRRTMVRASGSTLPLQLEYLRNATFDCGDKEGR